MTANDPNHNHSSMPESTQLKPSKKGMGRIVNASVNSMAGFEAAYRNEAAFRQIMWICVASFIGIVVLPLSMLTKMVLVLASLLCVIVELLNTGIEAAIDHTSLEWHPLAKIAKDVGSAAQLVALTGLFILWTMALASFW